MIFSSDTNAMKVNLDKYYFLKILEISCYKFADVCVGLSPGIVEGITKYIPHRKTVLISNYSNTDFFEPKINFNVTKKIKLIRGAINFFIDQAYCKNY